MLKKIPGTIKRLLDSSYRTLYRRGKINGDLALTDDGHKAFNNYMLTVGGNVKGFAKYVQDENKKESEEEEEEG